MAPVPLPSLRSDLRGAISLTGTPPQYQQPVSSWNLPKFQVQGAQLELHRNALRTPVPIDDSNPASAAMTPPRQLSQYPDAMPRGHASLSSLSESRSAEPGDPRSYGQSPASFNESDQWCLASAAGGDDDSEEWKRARRKEQCRINQANYRRRKRQYEMQLGGQIQALEQEIECLSASKAAAMDAKGFGAQQEAADPIQAIGDFYFALEAAHNQQQQLQQQPQPQQREASRSGRDTPALQSLFDLQREEFDSVEALRRHWLGYCEQFRLFHLFIISSERVEAGDHVVIKIAAELHLDITSYDWEGGYGPLVCPVLQQFEFETGERVLTRITSEIDLVAGAATMMEHSGPESTLKLSDLLGHFETQRRQPSSSRGASFLLRRRRGTPAMSGFAQFGLPNDGALLCGILYPGSAIFRTAWPTHPDVAGQPVLQLGVSIESLDNVKNLGIEASGLAERKAFALKIAQDLFNYLSSFSTSTNQSYMTIPTNLLDRWMERFEAKYRRDPNFMMKIQ
ncbi:hypothetical protein BBJ28_00008643 [Nothophytophthora sp. Chile5]|nr:hypothetical protein BBJ28_00008643 [Nothophytophthora sp. Chile5]